jgi:hypothetical protein
MSTIEDRHQQHNNMPGFLSLSLSQLHAKLEVPSWSIMEYDKYYFLCILKKHIRLIFYVSLLAYGSILG